MRVTLVSAWADRVEERSIELPDGTTLSDALVAFGIEDPTAADVGIEQYRPLIADPKQARHRRANEQGYRWQGRTRRAATGHAKGNANANQENDSSA